MKRIASVVLFLLVLCGVAHAQTATLIGTISAPQTTAPLRNATLQFALSQAAIVTGTATLTTSPVTCSTSIDGSIHLLPNVLAPPVAAANYSSGSVPSGTYYVALSYITTAAATETLVGPTIAVAMSGTGNLRVIAPTLQPTGAAAYRVYVGTTPTALHLQSTVATFIPNTVSSYASGGAAPPGANNTVCTLRANDATIPQTSYKLSGTAQNGATVPGLALQIYLPSGTTDISNGFPLSGVQPRFPNPIIANPASQATQSINSPLTLNGFSLTSGATIYPVNNTPPTPQSGTGYIYEYPSGTLNIVSDNVNISPFLYNKTCLAASQVGANAGAKIAACMATVNAQGGGIVDATGLLGAQNVTQDVWSGVTTPISLKLGYIVVAATQTQNMCTGCSVDGAGRDETIWNYTGSGTAWSFSAAAPRTTMTDMQIRTSQAGSTVGILVTTGVENVFDNLLITAGSPTSGFAYGIKITGSVGFLTTRAKFTNVDVDYYRTAGIAIDHVEGVALANMFFMAELDSTAADAILLDSLAQEIFMQTVSTIYGRHGIMLRNTLESPTVDNAPANIFADQLRVDTTSGGAGFYFDSTLADAQISFVCTDCWAEGAGRSNANTHVTTANGIQHNGGRNVRFIGCRVLVADKSGVEIADADVANVVYDSCIINQNNQSSDADGQGVYVTAAAKNVKVLNSWFGNDASSGDTKYGVKIAAVDAAGLEVSGNDFSATLTTGAVSNANTGTTLVGPNTPLGVLATSLTQDEVLTKFRTAVAADSPVTVLATDSVLLCNAAAGGITYNLPAVADAPNKTYTMKKIDAVANACTLDGNASETIDGATTLATSTQWGSFVIANNGTAWYVLSKN